MALFSTRTLVLLAELLDFVADLGLLVNLALDHCVECLNDQILHDGAPSPVSAVMIGRGAIRSARHSGHSAGLRFHTHTAGAILKLVASARVFLLILAGAARS